MSARLVVICFDVCNHRRRARVARWLERHGRRVQKSVFECELTPKQLAAVLEEAARRMDRATDSVRAYRLCAACGARVTHLGCGAAPLAEEPVIQA